MTNKEIKNQQEEQYDSIGEALAVEFAAKPIANALESAIRGIIIVGFGALIGMGALIAGAIFVVSRLF